MKEILNQLAAYQVWANATLLKLIETLPEEELLAQRSASFPSLYKTSLHLLDAESIWWQRLKLQERIERPSEAFSGNFAELSAALQKQDKQWQNWVQAASEAMLQHEFIYRNLKKQRFKQPVYQMLLHLFNHGTYHRGQLVTMLREAGVQKIPQTDFMVWSRKK